MRRWAGPRNADGLSARIEKGSRALSPFSRGRDADCQCRDRMCLYLGTCMRRPSENRTIDPLIWMDGHVNSVHVHTRMPACEKVNRTSHLCTYIHSHAVYRTDIYIQESGDEPKPYVPCWPPQIQSSVRPSLPRIRAQSEKATTASLVTRSRPNSPSRVLQLGGACLRRLHVLLLSVRTCTGRSTGGPRPKGKPPRQGPGLCARPARHVRST